MFTTVEGPMTALSLCRDANAVVVAGKNVLKIYSITEDGDFLEVHNLRVGKHVNLNYSCVDVAWSAVDDNKLATASTNGAIVIFDLNKNSNNKTENILSSCARAMNSVCFHPMEPDLLLGGSQDGMIRLFDLRTPDAVLTFGYTIGGIESVRDVQFSPHSGSKFASADESGVLKLWDYRVNDRCQKSLTAHYGPIYGIDCHPENRNWIATAGRDKCIKIWNVEDPQRKCEYFIQTIAGVNRLRWKPGGGNNMNHMASCPMTMDFSIYVWDINRPFVPMSLIEDHKDVTTGIAWRQVGSVSQIISCSKDCTLQLHTVEDHFQPQHGFREVGLTISPHGDVAVAVCDNVLKDDSSTSSWTGSFLSNNNRMKRSLMETQDYLSSVVVFSRFPDESIMSMDPFVHLAKKYKLSGRCIGELCAHNAKVAQEAKMDQIAQTWMMLRNCFTCTNHCKTPGGSGSKSASGSVARVSTETDFTARPVGLEPSDIESLRMRDGEMGNAGFRLGDVDLEADEEADFDRSLFIGATQGQDDFFIDGEVPIQPRTVFDDFEDFMAGHTENSSEWTLPSEPFQPKVDITQSSPPVHVNGGFVNDFNHHAENHDDQLSSSQVGLMDERAIDEERKLKVAAARKILNVSLPSETKVPNWDPIHFIRDLLYYFADVGDVQMAVCVSLVFREKLRGLVNTQDQERWFSSYLELLEYFNLWIEAATIRKFCLIINIQQQSLDSTAVFVNCHRCQKPLAKGWYCDRCRQLTSGCSVCNASVRGLYSWCQGCGHGGHLKHISDWFAVNKFCPTGCGHQCDF